MKTIHTMSQADIDAAPVLHDEPGFGSLRSAAGNLPLAALDVDAKITGLVSRVTVRQTYVNNLDQALEATYIFPLPSRAAVTDFVLKVGDRVVVGELKERGAARAEYHQAIQDGKRAALAEEDRPDVFTMQVGNIMPGEQAEVTLTYSGPIPLVDHEACFRFPLVVAPRYIPGQPLDGRGVGDGVAHDTDAVPDASRITPPVLLPGFKSPVALSLRVELDAAGLELGEPRVSLHTIEEQGTNGRRVLALQPGERLNRDFILRYAVAGAAVGDSLVLQPDAEGGEGTFLLTLTPPAAAHATARPRDVVFVLDRSGSMGGWKMVAARRALARMLDTLSDQDRVQVLAFDNSVEVPHDGLQAATDRRRYQTIEFLAKVDARGGTEMLQPLVQGLDLLRSGDAGRDRVLVLVTDGQVGNEDQLLRHANLDDVRVFTLGIDRAVNEGFLRRFAELGGGEFELVETEDRLDEVMDRIHRRIGAPVLTGLTVQAEGMQIDAGALVPQRLPDLFAGTPLLLYGRYSGASASASASASAAATATTALQLEARTATGTRWTARVEGRTVVDTAVPPLWARGRIRGLEDRHGIAASHYSTEDAQPLSEQIVATSLRFGVLSRFTAFVAVDQEVVNEGGATHQVTQPVEAPDGWEMFEPPMAAAGAAPMECGLAEESLGDAIMQSMPRSKPGFGPASPTVESIVRGLGSMLGGGAKKRKRSGREREKAASAGGDLRAAVEAARDALRRGVYPDGFGAGLCEVLDRLLAGELPQDLRRRLTDLRLDLESTGLTVEFAVRLVAVLDEVLADDRRRAAFWK